MADPFDMDIYRRQKQINSLAALRGETMGFSLLSSVAPEHYNNTEPVPYVVTATERGLYERALLRARVWLRWWRKLLFTRLRPSIAKT